MNIIVFGSKGLLGSKIIESLKKTDHKFFMADKPEYNLSSFKQIDLLFRKNKFDYAINCAAYTDVENSETEKKEAFISNCRAVGVLAKISYLYDCHIIHFGTDFVFDGTVSEPYKETDLSNPINYYGVSKLQGEKVLLDSKASFNIYRLQWLYDLNKNVFPIGLSDTILTNKNHIDEPSDYYSRPYPLL